MKLLNSTISPMLVIGDTLSRVVFVSQGYTIGLGEQLMKAIHGLQQTDPGSFQWLFRRSR